MIKTKTIVKQIEEEIIDDVICNKCGESCKPVDTEHAGFEGLPFIEVSGGYYSKYIGDGTVLKFSLCEKCVRELVNSFKIPAQETNDF